MAGKHSKSFFEQIITIVGFDRKSSNIKAISLPLKIIISATALSLTVSLVLVCAYFVPSKINEKLLSDAVQTFERGNSHTEGVQILTSENSDIKGWLKIDGTNVNCAVCQTDNDSYYINHNQQKKKSRYGALFLSANDSFVRNGDKNIVIYGNNMKDGSMFGSLKKYRNVNFYKQNPCINLYYEGYDENYIIFAVMLIGSFSEEGKNPYNPSKSYFAGESDFENWYSETTARSLIDTTVKLNYGDEILTLVTTAKDFEGARLVVMAKKSTEWQISQTDVTAAKANSKIKYPKAWYTQRGIEYPY